METGMSAQRIVIIGAALAGATAAVTLRDEGFEGEIKLIGAERQLPYNRPPLSKGDLRGEERFEDQLVNPAGAYAEKGIELRLGTRATAIDATRKHVEVDGSERIAYDQLLVATGGRNRSVSMPGAELNGVLQLRTVEESDRIRAAAQRGSRAVVVGLGFIGSEVVTPTARRRGDGTRTRPGATRPRPRSGGRRDPRRHPSRQGRGAGARR